MRRTRLLSGLAAASLISVPAIAVAHGGGPGGPGGGPGGLAALACDVPASATSAIANTAAVKRIKARLDARVKAGIFTQAQADERLEDFVTSIALRKIVGEAASVPLAKLLGISVADLEKARRDGTLRDKVEAKNLTETQLRTAMREGRTAAQAKMTELCGDLGELGGPGLGGPGGPGGGPRGDRGFGGPPPGASSQSSARQGSSSSSSNASATT